MFARNAKGLGKSSFVVRLAGDRELVLGAKGAEEWAGHDFGGWVLLPPCPARPVMVRADAVNAAMA